MTPAAFRATFAKVQPVSTRKVVQFTFEVPVEQSAEVLDSLGGFPDASKSVWVAIARLDVAKVEKPAGKTPSQRAWALCQSGRFQEWLTGNPACGADMAAAQLRDRLAITSRGELDTNPEARARFESLEREYLEAQR